MNRIDFLRTKAHRVRRETLRLHALAPGIRIASCLSAVEIFTTLYHGGLLSFRADDPHWEGRDRVIASKGHGSVALYPILSELGFFDPAELARVGTPHSFLGVIPDALVPGIETTNGSVGHGPGVACGMALGLKRKGGRQRVYVVVGDGEMNAGAVWEAVAFASFHRLDNLILIIDDNRKSILGLQEEILGLHPLGDKLAAFRWHVDDVDGHDPDQLLAALTTARDLEDPRPRAIIAHTVKGRGIAALESDPMSHVTSFSPEEVRRLLAEELPP